MGFDSPSPGFLSSQLRGKREGIQFERILRGLSFVLDEWCRYKGDRKPLYGETGFTALGVIHFDKLAQLFFRLWNELFDRHKEEISGTTRILLNSDVQTLVTFPSPFLELPGKHGRGAARFTGALPPIYIVDSLYALQQDGIQYFEITPPDGTSNPKDHRTTVRPAMHIDPSQFLDDFTGREIEIVRDIARAVRRLGPSEIRALGTHENHRKTIEDVKKEFKDMERYRRAVVDSVKAGELSLSDCEELAEYADEAWRKTKYNRTDYKDACQIMLQELSDSELREVFDLCQSPTDAIWDGTDMAGLAERAELARWLGMYLKAVAMVQSGKMGSRGLNSRTAFAKQFYGTWGEAVKLMRDSTRYTLPGDINEVFEPSKLIISESLKATLLDALAEIAM